MNIDWRLASPKRSGYYADHAGRRLYVEQSARSRRAFGIVGTEFQAAVSGVRLGEYKSFEVAKRLAIIAAETKTASQDGPRGCEEVGVGFDY